MGTLARITVYASGPADAARAFTAGFARIRELEGILSDYQPGSELNRLTRDAVGREVPVSHDLFTVLEASQALARATGGAFDVTQGPVVRLWRDARRRRTMPDAEALAEAAARSGFEKLHLEAGRRSVRLDQPGMALDAGAIGKGYAASEALAALAALGFRQALVAISGDLALGDAPPGARGWRVRVHDMPEQLPAVPEVLWLTNTAVSTSGNAEQHLDAGGRRYSHIIDPASRLGLTDDLTVTVVAPHGLDADGLDTAISVLGPEKGLALVETRAGSAALIVRRSASGATAFQSRGFERLAQAAAADPIVPPTRR
jgi:thiamine biosynthesis lipoprotein